MTYGRTQVPAGSVTPEEINYSPFVPSDEDYIASMGGSYEGAGGAPYAPMGMQQFYTNNAPYAPRGMQQRVMQMPESYAPPPGYKLVPLSGDSSTGMSNAKKVAIVVAVIIVIAGIVYYLKTRAKTSKPAVTPTQAVKKLPTSRLAQNLYARLEKNGKGSRSVLAALDKLATE